MRDSFETNEQMARRYAEQASGRPMSKATPQTMLMKRADFESALDMHPVKEGGTPSQVQGTQSKQQPSQGSRQRINIDENEDTIHNAVDLKNILNRGKKLQARMDEALGEDAWEQIHGKNELPKKYVPPFLRDSSPNKQHEDLSDVKENLYALEVEAGLNKKGADSSDDEMMRPGGLTRAPNHVSFPHDANRVSESGHVAHGGNGGNIRDMRFIRLKIKSLVIEDGTLLQELHSDAQGFSLTCALPLPDIYQHVIADQFVKLSNKTVVSENEFDFTNLSLYNFQVNEETFNDLSRSHLQIMLDEKAVHGEIQMSRLLMAPNFALKTKIPLMKTVLSSGSGASQAKKEKKQTAADKRQEQMKKARGRSANQLKEEVERGEDAKSPQKTETKVGYLEIEINLQRGDTEEELERNYQLKLKHQEEARKQEAELVEMQRKKSALMRLEEQGTFAQLYLYIEEIGKGGITIDREGNSTATNHHPSDTQNLTKSADDLSRDQSGMPTMRQQQPEEKGASKEENSNKHQSEERNLYVAYKAFPTYEKLTSQVHWKSVEPAFNFRSQFPVPMNPDVIQRLETFTFIVEVWDQIQPGRSDLVGLVKIPLQYFCESLKATEQDIVTMAAIAEQHNAKGVVPDTDATLTECLQGSQFVMNKYPMVISDEPLPIYSPKHGKEVGSLKVLLALGTPSQINRQVQREMELERTRYEAQLQRERAQMQTLILKDIGKNSMGKDPDAVDKKQVQSLIEENNQRQAVEEEQKTADIQDKSPFSALFNLKSSQGKAFEGNESANKFANALRQSQFLSPIRNSMDYDMRGASSHLDALRKLFDELRVAQDINDFTSDELFADDVKQFDGSVHKDEFVYTLLNREEFTLTRSELSNISTLLMLGGSKQKAERGAIDLDELQFSYTSYLKVHELVEARVIDLLEKFKLSIVKKLESEEQIEGLIAAIELKANESKVTLQDLKVEMEQKRGIQIREVVYDQLAAFFDLDRSGLIYISSFCAYMRDPSAHAFNFFKLNTSVITQHVISYIKDCLAVKPELIETIEEELREEFSKREGDNRKRKQALAKKKKKKSKKTNAEDSDTVNLGGQEEEIAAKDSAQIDVCFVIESESKVSEWARRIALQIQETISAIRDWNSEVLVRASLCGQGFNPLNFESDLTQLVQQLEAVSVNRKIKNEPLQEVMGLDWGSGAAKAVIRIGDSASKRPSPADFSHNQIEVCWIESSQSADFIIKTSDHLIQASKRQETRQKRQERAADESDLEGEGMIARSEWTIHSKLFQVKLKRLGIACSLWEMFALFEYINLRLAKSTFEPQRYHYVTFEHLHTLLTSSENDHQMGNQSNANGGRSGKDKRNKKGGAKNSKKAKKAKKEDSDSDADALSLAKNLNGAKAQNTDSESESSSSSDSDEKSAGSDSDSDLSNASLSKSERNRRKEKRREKKEAKKAYTQVKHVFSVDIKELKNMPILTKFIKEARDYESAQIFKSSSATTTTTDLMRASNANNNPTTASKEEDVVDSDRETDFASSAYIQNVAVKYSFPLDEDEILESDYIKRVTADQTSQGSFDYAVSMNSVHTYLMPKEDQIKDLLAAEQSQAAAKSANQASSNLFNLSLVLYQDSREFVIGNSQLPIEDLCDLVRDFENKKGAFETKDGKAVLKRVLFLYGTSYSQRENCIIGKVAVEISYAALKQFLSKQEAKDLKKQEKRNQKNRRGGQGPPPTQSCFLHRETYINRKIPLNALLSVHIDRVTNLKESIENIEHFARIHRGATQEENLETADLVNNSLGSAEEKQIDRRKVLTQILKHGMNLEVKTSIFQEDSQLTERFPQSNQTTRMLYNSLNPVFGETYQLPVQMDTKIFDYLKTRKAVFELRHYIMGGGDQQQTSKRQTSLQENVVNYITLGYVRVPLLHLITKNNGIDGEFVVMDDYRQKMGALRLRIALNHHNTQRPLFAGSTQIPNQISATRTPSGAPAGLDGKSILPANSTIIDKSVTLRNNLASGGRNPMTIPANGTMKSSSSQEKHFGQQILALNFIELILMNRPGLFEENIQKLAGKPLSSSLYLKFRFCGANYQTKFVSLEGGSIGAEDHPTIQSSYARALQMLCFEIQKTVFLPIDLADQASVEQAFGTPLEVQLWHRVIAREPCRQPDLEQTLGSFYLELNELPKTINTRVKGNQQDKFVCAEAYYTLVDSVKNKVSRDRLAVRAMLFQNQNEESIAELDSVFHAQSRGQIEKHIMTTLDPLARGYVEMEDLQNCIEEKEQDPRVINRMLTLVNDLLEFKNQDSVFYSPLFGLPPPYLRHAKSLDTFEVVEECLRELTALDSHEEGFVPLAIFISALEHKLRLKPKIIDDFVESLRQPTKSMDVNCTANRFQAHLDFVVLIRKLLKLVEIKNACAYQADATLKDSMLHKSKQVSFRQTCDQISLSVDIESAMRLKNPVDSFSAPNTFVVVRPPTLDGLNQPNPPIQTNTVNESCYPSWQSRNHKIEFPLTSESVQKLASSEQIFEFDVYHSFYESQIQTTPTQTLIGTAQVDIAALAIDKNSAERNFVSGYFHLFKEKVALADPVSATKLSQGQLKITIRATKTGNGSSPATPTFTTSDPLRQSTDTLRRSLTNVHNNNYSGLISQKPNQNPFTASQATFAANTRDGGAGLVRASCEEREFRFSQKMEIYEAELASKDYSELVTTHKANLDALDSIFDKLKNTLNEDERKTLGVAKSTTTAEIQESKALSEDDEELERAEDQQKPAEEVKFSQQINTTNQQVSNNSNLVPTPPTVKVVVKEEEKAADFVRNEQLGTTQQTQAQRQTMADQMRHQMNQSAFNPFKSIEEKDEETSAAATQQEVSSFQKQ